jgi:hypothetical protein
MLEFHQFEIAGHEIEVLEIGFPDDLAELAPLAAVAYGENSNFRLAKARLAGRAFANFVTGLCTRALET